MMQKKGSRFKDIGAMQTLKIVDNKYIIKNHILGKGSFSTTFLALREGKDQLIACKMIAKKDLVARINSSKNKLPTKDYLLNALKNEVNTWKTLNHPNIVSFYDFSETASNIYFFLELCEDGSLDKLVSERGRLPEPEAIQLFTQMADGCEYLYEKGIFHRDIKPENILMHKGAIKIADFGFVKVIEKQGVATTSVGTPCYMAPQVLEGTPYGIKCDVWSLGVVFYQALCGFMPWQTGESYQTLRANLMKGCSFPAALKINPTLEKLIFGMLRVQQNERMSIVQVGKILRQLSGKMDVQ